MKTKLLIVATLSMSFAQAFAGSVIDCTSAFSAKENGPKQANYLYSCTASQVPAGTGVNFNTPPARSGNYVASCNSDAPIQGNITYMSEDGNKITISNGGNPLVSFPIDHTDDDTPIGLDAALSSDYVSGAGGNPTSTDITCTISTAPN